MVLIARFKSDFFNTIYIDIYLGLTIFLLAIFIFSYFFISLKDYLRNFSKLKKTKTKSLSNGLALNALAWIAYLSVGVVVKTKLQAAEDLNPGNIDGYTHIFGSLSAFGFLGIFIAINIFLTFAGFIYWTHFRFVMAADLFLHNPEVAKSFLHQKNNTTLNDWNIITLSIMAKNPVLMTKNGVNKWTHFTDFYEKNKYRRGS